MLHQPLSAQAVLGPAWKTDNCTDVWRTYSSSLPALCFPSAVLSLWKDIAQDVSARVGATCKPVRVCGGGGEGLNLNFPTESMLLNKGRQDEDLFGSSPCVLI